MTTTIYGIKNCDTVRKARKWLDNNNIQHRYHDFREDGLDKKTLQQWCKTLGWETVLNKRSTSWKNLDDSQKSSLDENSAIELMLDTPTLVKRPVLEHGKHTSTGFSEKNWQTLFKT